MSYAAATTPYNKSTPFTSILCVHGDAKVRTVKSEVLLRDTAGNTRTQLRFPLAQRRKEILKRDSQHGITPTNSLSSHRPLHRQSH